MELTGKLKEQVEQAKDKTEAKEMIAKAGMQLTDEELDQVGGGEYWQEKYEKTREPDHQMNRPVW